MQQGIAVLHVQIDDTHRDHRIKDGRTFKGGSASGDEEPPFVLTKATSSLRDVQTD